jgi:hypothetical protein
MSENKHGRKIAGAALSVFMGLWIGGLVGCAHQHKRIKLNESASAKTQTGSQPAEAASQQMTQTAAQSTPAPKHDILEYATIEGFLGQEEIPVYAFGFTYIYGVSPDLLPGAVMQDGNTNPIVKVKRRRRCGMMTSRCCQSS